MGGGAAFWAARGVRIEPEIATDEVQAAEEIGRASCRERV